MAGLTSNERNALAAVARLEDPVRLREMIKNARRHNSAAVEAAAFERLCFVQPEATPGTVGHDVWQAVHASEQMHLEERGKTVRLTRTRQKIARDGEAKTAADLTLKADPSPGFLYLQEKGQLQLAFEAVVLRHPLTFDEDVRSAARARFESIGVDPEQFEKGEANG